MNTALLHTASPRPGVVELVLNRPEKRNALNIPLLQALCAAIERANGDDTVRAIVLRASGETFCAGLDLKEARDPETSHASAELIARSLRGLYLSPKLCIAVVQGTAVAGGAGLVSACDIALAAMNARFGYPEVRVGMVALQVSTLLRRQVGDRHARELLLLGETITAERAEAMGLITRAVPRDVLDETLEVVLAEALQGAPGAIHATKQFLDELAAPGLEAELRRALELHLAVRQGSEAREGFQAFVEKRAPSWRRLP